MLASDMDQRSIDRTEMRLLFELPFDPNALECDATRQ